MNFKLNGEVLTPAYFYILLALIQGERHCYDVTKQMREDSNGMVVMERGNVHNSMMRLLKFGLIEEVETRALSELDDTRRRYFRITAHGEKRLVQELERYAKVIAIARKRNLC